MSSWQPETPARNSSSAGTLLTILGLISVVMVVVSLLGASVGVAVWSQYIAEQKAPKQSGSVLPASVAQPKQEKEASNLPQVQKSVQAPVPASVPAPPSVIAKGNLGPNKTKPAKTLPAKNKSGEYAVPPADNQSPTQGIVMTLDDAIANGFGGLGKNTK
jgi:hypothetical protein